MKDTRSEPSLISLLIVLGILVILALLLARPEASPEAEPAPEPRSLGEQIRTGDAPLPAFTADVQAQLEAFPEFDAAISYTDSGFEPERLVIERGAVVRFVNNSSEAFWIAADASTGTAYPQTRQGCSSSDLDSCGPVAPMSQWSFRFDESGIWHIQDNLSKDESMIVEVR